MGDRKPITGGTVMEYLTAQEIADKWNLSKRMVQQFCIDGRIPGAQTLGYPCGRRKAPGSPVCPAKAIRAARGQQQSHAFDEQHLRARLLP